MNIHEHQAKQILRKYSVVVPEGVFALTVDELVEKAKSLKTKKYVLKAQIHAGGRGKAGGPASGAITANCCCRRGDRSRLSRRCSCCTC